MVWCKLLGLLGESTAVSQKNIDKTGPFDRLRVSGQVVLRARGEPPLRQAQDRLR